MQLNDSVKDMLGQVSFSQMFLMGKMQAALNAYQPNGTPPTPAGINNILASAGTGQHSTGPGSLDVPFGPPFLQVGNYVAPPDINNRFEILADGTYEINYQLAVATENQAFVHLAGSLSGMLDNFILQPPPFTLGQRTVTRNLNAGELVWLHVDTSGPNEVLSQAITFIKIG